MKLWVGFTVFLWLLSGLIGAWVLDDLDLDHWKIIAQGPMTLIKAINENPVSIPTQD